MCLRFLVGYLLVMTYSFAEECSIGRTISDYKSTQVVVDDVVFHLHFPNDKPWFTNEVIKILKKDVPLANKYFNAKPLADVHLVIENSLSSNGSATVFPYNIITLNDFPPLGNNYLAKTKDWIRNLVIHEYIHIIAMDMTSGWIKYLRTIFGSAVKVNGVIPRWLNEGTAVWYESLEKGAGRLNQPEVKYQVYKALNDSKFCQGIDCLDLPLKYPFGHAPYWIGGEFVRYLEENKPGFVACIFQNHSSSLPFLLNRIFIKCTGRNVSESYQEFRKFYLETNAEYAHLCPVNESFCAGLRKWKIDETKIDFEGGVCQQDDQLLFIVREEKGRGELNLRHKLQRLNQKTGQIHEFYSQFPVIQMTQKKELCIIQQSIQKACQEQIQFSEFKIPELKLEHLITTNAVAISKKTDKSLTLIDYNDGVWTFNTGPQKQKIVVRKKNIPVLIPSESSTLTKQFVKNEEQYQARHYLIPQFFLFDYSNFANLSALKLNTRLIDPLKAHSVNISLADYFNDTADNYWGGSLLYSRLESNRIFSVDYIKSFFINSLENDDVASSDDAGLSLSYFCAYNHWRCQTVLGLRYSRRKDFLSTRVNKSFSFGQNFSLMGNYLLRKQRAVSLGYSLSAFESNFLVDTAQDKQDKRQDEQKETFVGLNFHIDHSFYASTRKTSYYGYRARYAKFFKDNLESGYQAAGGVNTYFASGYPFPLYTVSYADLIGNEMTTLNPYYRMRFANIYKGFDMLPVFMKDLHLEVGAEYAKASYFLTEKKIYTDEYLTGLYLRQTLSTRLAYLWDSSFSLALAQLFYPQAQTRLLFLFDAAAF